MPRRCMNHVTYVARESLLSLGWKPCTGYVPLGVHFEPERRLVLSSSQLRPLKPAPGDVLNGPVSWLSALGPVQVRVSQWSGSSRLTEISFMYVSGKLWFGKGWVPPAACRSACHVGPPGSISPSIEILERL